MTMPPMHDCQQIVSWLYGNVTATAAIAKTGTHTHTHKTDITSQHDEELCPNTVVTAQNRNAPETMGSFSKISTSDFHPLINHTCQSNQTIFL